MAGKTLDVKNGWRLSPAYDITYSDTYFGEHTTSVNGKGRGVKFDDFKTVGKGLRKGKKVKTRERLAGLC